MHQSDPARLVVATAEEIVVAVAGQAETLAVFRRRMLAALHDARLLAAVGPDFVRIGSCGLEFADLDFRRDDALLHALQDLGRRN